MASSEQDFKQIIAQFNELMASLSARMDRLEAALRVGPIRNLNPTFERHHSDIDEGDDEVEGSYHSSKGERRDMVNNLHGIELTIPEFVGKSDPDAYIEWEKKVDLIFDIDNYSEEMKVKLAAVSFSGYAITWWDQLCWSRKMYKKLPVSTWDDMKAIMKKRFVPPHYFHKQLQNITQGSKSVDEYYKDLEMARIRANVEEDPEATIARFLSGLNHEISKVVEIHNCMNIEEMVHTAEVVEKQLKRRNFNPINSIN